MLTRIDEQFREALKSKDKKRISTLRMLRSGIKNKEIEKKPKELKESDIIDVISKLVKQHKESIQQFEKGGREDLVKKEQEELKILQEFLPKQLTEEEIKDMVQDVITEVNASGKKDMGLVMGKIMPKVKGRADGKIVSGIVSEMLSELEK